MGGPWHGIERHRLFRLHSAALRPSWRRIVVRALCRGCCPAASRPDRRPFAGNRRRHRHRDPGFGQSPAGRRGDRCDRPQSTHARSCGSEAGHGPRAVSAGGRAGASVSRSRLRCGRMPIRHHVFPRPGSRHARGSPCAETRRAVPVQRVGPAGGEPRHGRRRVRVGRALPVASVLVHGTNTARLSCAGDDPRGPAPGRVHRCRHRDRATDRPCG